MIEFVGQNRFSLSRGPQRFEKEYNQRQGWKIMTQKPMTKTQLVAALAEATGSDKATANATLQAITDIVTAEVSAGGAVTLPGLGKFVCRSRPDRMVRNPATGEQMHKDADRVAKVTIAKALKDAVNA